MKQQNTGIHTIYVGNLNYQNDEDHILGLFKKFGYVKNIKILREGKENKSKGIAFVDMVVLEQAQKAIKNLDQSVQYGRTLKVSLAKTQNFHSYTYENKEESEKKKPKRPKEKPKKVRRQRKLSSLERFLESRK